MARPKGTPTVQWAIQLPEELAARVELLITDPVIGRPPKGLKSQLATELLYQWLARRRKTEGKERFRPEVISGPFGKQHVVMNLDNNVICETPSREWAARIAGALNTQE